jgi:hypothetical protein
MEHPLIGNIDHLTENELSEKINDLSKKLSIAARTGNGHLCDQIRMALESYQNKYRERLAEQYNKTLKDANIDADNKINIR